MEIKKGNTIKLNDNNEYIVVSIITYNNDKYIYLADINNNSNIKFCMEKIENEITKMIEIDDADLIGKLLPLFIKDTQDVVLDLIDNI